MNDRKKIQTLLRMYTGNVIFKNTPDPSSPLFSLMLQATIQSKVRKPEKWTD